MPTVSLQDDFTHVPDLPRDVRSVLELAARSMFQLFADTVEGMMLVDRQGKVIWISEGYKQFLPALGFQDESEFVGHAVEEVVPNTLMREVIATGRPILVDLLTNKAGTFLVSRIPLRDDRGEVIGALGMVLMAHPESTMQPLMKKFARLQRELDDARKQLAEQRRPKYTFASFIGSSPQVMEVKRQARRVAQTDSTVLLLGETGTGKELLAHAIHAASSRAGRPFIGVNIAAIPETLLEAEFFGVAPGAYTGADRKGRDGKFKLADGGTLFLDEIGDMPLALQAKLLRALQEQEIEPLGSNQVLKVDVRVIAATSRDLPQLVAEGKFREDLYYRLNVVPIRLPSLRERLGDLEALVEFLGEDISRRSGMPHRDVAPDAFEVLRAHPWRGNIRELRNVLEQVTMLTDDLRLEARHFRRALATPESPLQPPVELSPASATAAEGAGAPGAPAVRPLGEAVAEVERQAIQAALNATGGNKQAAARLLKISRATLYEKLAQYGPVPWPPAGGR
ncbi:sigma-54 interaction domain-containing protein [Caldimonas thermodepolymerans]|uniref:Transcriptional regulator with PAS, ATPase and Fis domain n=1 Tax=Caldimonas thermodepolymerans TaxID=215580 RepID=A0AA46DB47_9BURK|nr:sigma 54-interacting transcriptional regulator [Caldimonas thermodepolymerans]TCP04126.1 transcriptional regulator with PAS, ATPase and Fis domain [Caldimonas thermodepolymerans]UZG47458.1 sigma 54-interacting transcriptional regulator [Caldimonas thermodepolymerans]